MIISIHQPNFFVFENVLDKIRRSDLFIALTRAQFTRNNYHSRFQHNGKWYTLACSQKLEPLIDKKYSNAPDDWAKIIRRLPQHAALLEEFSPYMTSSLVETNLAVLHLLRAKLGITTPVVRDHPTELIGTARLVALCKAYGATEYLSGPSGPEYLNYDLFEKAGIKVLIQEPTQKRSALELLAQAGS